MVLLLALLIVVALYTGFFSKKDTLPKKAITASNRADNMLMETDFQHIIQAIESYFSDYGRYPESLGQLIPVYLRTKRECLDPWGTPYQLATENQDVISLLSAGKDKIFKTSDDLKRRIQ